MRKSLYALCAALCVLTAVSCSKEEAKTENVLVVYTPNSEALVKATIPAFEAKYNVKVELIQSGTGQLIKRLQTEKDAPYADVIWGGSYSTMRDRAFRSLKNSFRSPFRSPCPFCPSSYIRKPAPTKCARRATK